MTLELKESNIPKSPATLARGVMGDHGFDDGKDLLLLVAGQSGNGFELAFELRLGPALATL